MSVASNSRIIVALDFPDQTPALGLIARLDPARCRVKVGKELFTRAGPDLVERLQGMAPRKRPPSWKRSISPGWPSR